MLVFNKNSARIKDFPTSPVRNGKVATEVSDHLIPAMTWADWELLQELHKVRVASQLCQDEGCPHSGTAHVCVNDVKPFNPDLFPSYDKQYESLAATGIKPAMNWQAVAADLQDQIKDWETKCTQLETHLSAAKLTEANLNRQIKELSKSLQHYRNAYFADQGKEGDHDA